MLVSFDTEIHYGELMVMNWYVNIFILTIYLVTMSTEELKDQLTYQTKKADHLNMS